MEPTNPDLDIPLQDDLLDLTINEEQQTAFNELTIVGSIILDKILKFLAVKSILVSAWNMGPFAHITVLGRNLINCSFSKTEDIYRIIRNSPWVVKGHIIVFLNWRPSATIDELNFTSRFWV